MQNIFQTNTVELSFQEMENINGGGKLSDYTVRFLTWCESWATEYPAGVA